MKNVLLALALLASATMSAQADIVNRFIGPDGTGNPITIQMGETVILHVWSDITGPSTAQYGGGQFLPFSRYWGETVFTLDTSYGLEQAGYDNYGFNAVRHFGFNGLPVGDWHLGEVSFTAPMSMGTALFGDQYDGGDRLMEWNGLGCPPHPFCIPFEIHVVPNPGVAPVATLALAGWALRRRR